MRLARLIEWQWGSLLPLLLLLLLSTSARAAQHRHAAAAHATHRLRSSEVHEVTPRSWQVEVDEPVAAQHDIAILFYGRSRRAVSWWTRVAERVPPKRNVLFRQFNAHKYDPPGIFADLLAGNSGSDGGDGGSVFFPCVYFVPRGKQQSPVRFKGATAGAHFSFTALLAWVISSNAATWHGRFEPDVEKQLGEPDPGVLSGEEEKEGRVPQQGIRVNEVVTAMSKQRQAQLQQQQQQQQQQTTAGVADDEDATAAMFFFVSGALLVAVALYLLKNSNRKLHAHAV